MYDAHVYHSVNAALTVFGKQLRFILLYCPIGQMSVLSVQIMTLLLYFVFNLCRAYSLIK